MKNFITTLSLIIAFTLSASAEDIVIADSTGVSTMPETEESVLPDTPQDSTLAMGTPEWQETTAAETDASLPSFMEVSSPSPTADFSFFKLKTNPGVKPYKFMDDMTFVGVPLFVAGIAIKGEKASFRQNYKDERHPNTRLITRFKTKIDDYTQYFGPAMTIGLKLGGYEGRSSWPRLLVSAGLSYATMALLVNTIKYTSSEMRPDGSTRNSWPSGHTATSFVGATILHKEYGLTRSPWFSVLGYGVATATGIMRVLNNRHWVSDVLSGAGIGILSTELGYALGNLIFKGRGLLRNDLEVENKKPSFFSISMGIGLGGKSISFSPDDLTNAMEGEEFEDNFNMKVDFRSATTVDAEGAYFFNKYIGIGGRFRVRAMTAKRWTDFIEHSRINTSNMTNEIVELYRAANPTMTDDEFEIERQSLITNAKGMIKEENFSIVSDHLTEFSANVGLYLNIPLSKRFSLGTKALIGRSMTQELEADAQYAGNVKDLDYKITIENGDITDLSLSKFAATDKDYNVTWDYITLGGNNTTTFGTGLSLTFRYKSNFLWKVFADYDYSRKTYTLRYDPYRFLKYATPNLDSFYTALGANLDPYEYKKKQTMHFFTLGASFAVNF
ncbi:MAG: phosphatase PAP2 family protein [Alloprevotella sp.]|nr:phosphatase PAP2 family protein [Alloprevotella sp.]